jgi:hypothetical protein
MAADLARSPSARSNSSTAACMLSNAAGESGCDGATMTRTAWQTAAVKEWNIQYHIRLVIADIKSARDRSMLGYLPGWSANSPRAIFIIA